MSVFYSSDDDLEIVDNFVPPSERRPRPKTPSRKRPASGSSKGFNGSPASKRTPNSASIKREKPESSMQAAKNAPKIVFGLDFGTTYSGLAYACLDKLDQISVLMNLDDSNNDSPKVPSVIQFAGDRVNWGNDIEKSVANTIEWFKLLLVDEDDLPEEVRTSGHVLKSRARLNKLNMTCEEVIACYLGDLWKQGLERVKTEVGKATVERSRFHVVVTLPAIWPDYSRERMFRAVQAADILEKRDGVADTVLTFVSEPEAAALATLKRVDGRCDVKPDDCFVICDCGGGTVDLIAYEVISVEPMVICEIVKGSGGLAGAVFVDSRFRILIKKKLDEIDPRLWDRVSAKDMEDIMSDDWLKMRNKFSGDPVQGFTVRAPPSLYEVGLLDAREGWRILHITSMDLEEVFKPVMEKIETLVRGQIRSVKTKQGQNPKYIVLVGGFGRCRYLYKWLKTRTSGIEVLQSQGAEPWTAICRGAVIHGMTVEKIDSSLGVKVRSRVARASYGIVCQETWDSAIHLEDDKVFDEQQQLWKARNQMKWLVNEGDDLATDKKFRYDFYRLIDLDNIPDSQSTTIWMCKTSPPPSRMDESVVKYSEMKWTSNIYWNRLPQFHNREGKPFYELNFQAVMQRSSGFTDLAIMRNGKRQATKNVQVEFFDKADL
ncbi:hypothetical protein N0V93_000401 [Gnomoniopsis smithogilvyi]|uniref:Actin-like ATPase domain-containing protein n=1 Tax=Gnomoniopsis smithogilvyi TaxID=1191159 RepID=A0A9W9D071_9PEZI|nr:hypothetical protein N0V93_000401 [Gnomoniopsis smithogilvyi]